MPEDKVKDAFAKVKQDIQDLKFQIETISNELYDLRSIILFQQTPKQTDRPTHPSNIPSIPQENPTQELNEPYNYPLEAVKSPISIISTGNDGVPTNRQTNQQTDRHIDFTHKHEEKSILKQLLPHQNPQIDHLQHISQTLESLDEIKRTLRQQFKRLTNQEMLVFSTIYQLESEHFTVDYPLIASKLSLSESSIRDYVIKINKKGVLIQKIKENNKKILLKIPEELKQMASLQTILTLREL